jgi:hypothetical protein
MVVMVVTATPTPDSPPNTDEASAEAQARTPITNATEETEAASTNTPNAPTPNATLSSRPTPTISEIRVAEQVFENGRMMWLDPTKQIWVMILDETGGGQWEIFTDTFEDGDPESDETLEVPEDKLQPTRGFGKLWRDNPEIREALGWATTPEFGYISRYEYHPGEDSGPGHHILFSLYGEAFRFNESGDSDWTWQLDEN